MGKHHKKHNRVPDMDAEEIIRTCQLLEQSEITKCDLLFSGSNYVFLTTLGVNGTQTQAIYKPRKGEAPLWDFPDGTLYKREYAAFLVSQAMGWDLIPPTVIRDGPYGIGSVQWLVETHGQTGRPTKVTTDIHTLKKVAVFDFITNNADRKAGHFLEARDGRLWLVDHGLTFNSVPKLRTVLWDFSGQKVPGKIMKDIRTLQARLREGKGLREALARLIDADEMDAFEYRIEQLIRKPVFTYPVSRRSVPWPWI